MTIISANLFEALKKAGVPSDLAQKASAEVAESTKIVLEQDNKIDRLEVKITSLQEELRTKFNLIIGISLMLVGTTLATLVSMIFLLIK